MNNLTRLQFVATKSVNNNIDDCILSNDMITLKNAENCILRSHEFTFTIDNKTYQEVIGHNERIGGNDEVCYLKLIQYIYIFLITEFNN